HITISWLRTQTYEWKTGFSQDSQSKSSLSFKTKFPISSLEEESSKYSRDISHLPRPFILYGIRMATMTIDITRDTSRKPRLVGDDHKSGGIDPIGYAACIWENLFHGKTQLFEIARSYAGEVDWRRTKAIRSAIDACQDSSFDSGMALEGLNI
ncbi:hypothetical protein Dimus_036642, partial [Dionaea muscipula]